MKALCNIVTGTARAALDLLYPPKCILCDTLFTNHKNSDPWICTHCLKKYPFSGWLSRENVLGPHKRKVSGICAAFEYTDDIKKLISLLKFRGKTFYAVSLGNAMAQVLAGYTDLFDAIVPVPLSLTRLKHRGYNQTDLLADELSKQLKVPDLLHALTKSRHTAKQSSLKGRKRYDNILNAFSVVRKDEVAGKRILLIDDVLTTGSTLGECADILWAAGAEKVYVCVVAAVSRHVQSSIKQKIY